jgi:hypothetical protein
MSERLRSKNVGGRGVTLLVIGLLVGIASVTIFYAEANLNYSAGGIPLGFDTSYYLAYSEIIKQQGYAQFVSNVAYYNILYPIIVSGIANFGISSITVETILPIVLSILTLVTAAYLTLSASGLRTGVISLAFFPGWFALYRMGADYHANLLAMPFLFFATALFLKVEKDSRLTKTRFASFVASVALSSISHVEVTLFFVAVWVLAALLWRLHGKGNTTSRGISIMALTGIAISLPLGFIWLEGVLYLVSSTGGVLASYSPVSGFWLEVMGVTVVFSLVGLGTCIWRATKLRQTGFLSLLLLWSTASIGIGAVGYLLPGFPISFSDRAILLFPVPFTAAIGLGWVFDRNPVRDPNFKVLIFLLMIIPIVTVPITYSYTAPRYFREYMDASTYGQLTSLAGNLGNVNDPVFVLNLPATCAGSLAILYSNWITTAVGQHHTYVGPVENLLAGKRTNYTVPESQIVSSLYYEKLRSAFLSTQGGLGGHPVILMDSLYQGRANFTGYQYDEPSSGVLVIYENKPENTSGLGSPRGTSLITGDFSQLLSRNSALQAICNPST